MRNSPDKAYLSALAKPDKKFNTVSQKAGTPPSQTFNINAAIKHVQCVQCLMLMHSVCKFKLCILDVFFNQFWNATWTEQTAYNFDLYPDLYV